MICQASGEACFQSQLLEACCDEASCDAPNLRLLETHKQMGDFLIVPWVHDVEALQAVGATEDVTWKVAISSCARKGRAQDGGHDAAPLCFCHGRSGHGMLHRLHDCRRESEERDF